MRARPSSRRWRLLARSGSALTDLQCGAHPPFDSETAAELLRRGEAPTPLHHNCSGKHAGMLLACVLNGWPREGYPERAHPLQIRIRELHAELGGVPLQQGHEGTDGCSVPALARLCPAVRADLRTTGRTGAGPGADLRCHNRAPLPHRRAEAAGYSADATGAWPRGGAEAFYGLAWRGSPHGPLGIALKVEDGGERGPTSRWPCWKPSDGRPRRNCGPWLPKSCTTGREERWERWRSTCPYAE